MRGLRLLVLSLVLGAAICGCREKTPGTVETEQKRTAEKQESEKEAAMGLVLEWLGHASFKIENSKLCF